jgi:hypothetical protein
MKRFATSFQALASASALKQQRGFYSPPEETTASQLA